MLRQNNAQEPLTVCDHGKKLPKKSGVCFAVSLMFAVNSSACGTSASPMESTAIPKQHAARHLLKASRPSKRRAGYILIQAAMPAKAPAETSCHSDRPCNDHTVNIRKSRTNMFQLPCCISHKTG